MPQKFGLYEDLSVIENLELYAKIKKAQKNFDELLEFTTLKPFKKRLAGKLSGGMKQKLGLACALLGNPELLVLDEPSVGVDPLSRLELLDLVRKTIKNNTTVIWSSSYLDKSYNFDTHFESGIGVAIKGYLKDGACFYIAMEEKDDKILENQVVLMKV